MDSNSRQISSKSILQVLLLFLIFFGLAAARRWQQLASPQVWDEDGRIVSGFLSNGWHEFLQPINGYLILVPKIITRISLACSIYYYPAVSTILACSFSAIVALAVTFSPTHLRMKWLCALLMFLVPSDAEVFALPLYSLWWAGILLMLVALWDEKSPDCRFRLLFLIIGGLSSPFIFVVLPVLLFRAFWHRRDNGEKVVALGAIGVAAIQAFFVIREAAATSPLWTSIVKYVVPKFCGWFLVGNFTGSYLLLWSSGIFVLTLIGLYLYGKRRAISAWIMVFLYFGAIGSSAFRVDPSSFYPVGGGPRYFFFSFLLTFWILCQLISSTETKWLRSMACAAVGVAAVNAIPVWTRYHDDLHWSENLVSARLFAEYEIPIEFNGQRLLAWSIKEPGPVWDREIQRDWFLSPGEVERLPTYAYRILPLSPTDEKGKLEIPIAGQAGKSDRTITIQSVGGRKMVILKLFAGRKIRFRSGPAKDFQSMQVVGYEDAFIPKLPITKDWVVLEFSNSKLPNEFTVKVEDQGQGVGEWSYLGTWD